MEVYSIIFSNSPISFFQTWNHAVAHAAREWAQKCEFISRPDKQWGQNMNYFQGREADRSPRQLFEESFKTWSDDSDRKLDGHRTYRYCGKKHTCSYVQVRTCFKKDFEYACTRKYAHSGFISLVQSLLPMDTLLRTYLTSLQLVTGTVWRR